MLGRLDPQKAKAVVVGGGVAGLLSAYFLDRAGFEVELYEGSPRFGGLIRTDRGALGLAESAAHSILATPPVLELFQDLEVEYERVRKDSRARFIYRNKKLRRMPLGLGEILKTLWRAFTYRVGSTTDPIRSVSVSQWALLHLGRAAHDYLITPMIRGIYGVEASQISVGAAFPKWVVPAGATLISHLRALKGRSKPRQERPFMIAPRYGMQDLTSRLEGRLRERLGESLRKNAPIAPGILESLGDSNLVLAVPAREAGVLLGEQSPALGEMLLRCRYTSMVSVTVFAPVRGFSRKIRGVGVLIPAQEKERQCLGILFNSSSFGGRVQNEREWVSLTLMLGGLDHADWTLKSDFEIRAIVEAELGSILGYRHVSGAELQLSIHRWPRAIPVYDAHLEEVWGLARSSWCLEPGRVLFGNYTGQVSLRGMIESWAQWTETFKKSTVSAAREC